MGRTLLRAMGAELPMGEWERIYNLEPGKVSTPVPPNSRSSYSYAFDWKNSVGTNPLSFVDNDWITLHFWLYLENTAPTSDRTLMRIRDADTGSLIMNMEHRVSDPNLLMFANDSGFVVAQAGLVYQGIWYRVEVKFQPEVGSSDVKVWIDGTIKSDRTGQDLDPGNNTNTIVVSFTNSVSNNDTFLLDDIVIERDDGANIDSIDTAPHKKVVVAYDWDQSGVTPDIGTDLDAGDWNNLKDIPYNDSTIAQYNGTSPAPKGIVTCDDGTNRSGPKDDITTEVILGALWGFRVKRNGGIFANQSVNFYGGGHATPSTDGTSSLATGVSLTRSFINYLYWADVTDSAVPTSSEWFQLGFEIGNSFDSRDLIVSGMGCSLVLQELAGAVLLLKKKG